MIQQALWDEPAPRSMERWAELEPPYRWVLGRRWDVALPVLAWIMLNPSTADGQDDDPTMRKVIEFSRIAGYGSCVVVNAYPLQVTDPKELLRTLKEDPELAIGPMQTEADMGATHLSGQAYESVMSFAKRWADAVIIDAIARGSATVIAWGSHCPAVRAFEILALLDEWNPPEHPLLCLGYTKDGHPRHPLMVPYAQPLELFERVGTLA